MWIYSSTISKQINSLNIIPSVELCISHLSFSPPSQLGIIGEKLHKYDMKTLKLLHVEKKKLNRKGARLDLKDTISAIAGDQVREVAEIRDSSAKSASDRSVCASLPGSTSS